MSYKSIIVNLAVDADPAPIVKLAAGLAGRFDAHLIGLAAADVPPSNGWVASGKSAYVVSNVGMSTGNPTPV